MLNKLISNFSRRIQDCEKMGSLNYKLMLLYNILLFTIMVLGFPFIIPVILVSDKRRGTFLHRLGLGSLPVVKRCKRSHTAKKKAIWVHALSVGEVNSAAPLIKRLKNRFQDREIAVSVSTRTGFEIADNQLMETADTVFFFPYDLTFSIKHIASKIDPDLVVIVETDIWPNFLFEMKKRNTPVIFVNARLSKRSFVGYKRFGVFTKPLFFCFANICTQSKEDAKRFQTLDVPPNRITVTGNIKFEQEFQPLPAEEAEKLKQMLRQAGHEIVRRLLCREMGEQVAAHSQHPIVAGAAGAFRYVFTKLGFLFDAQGAVTVVRILL